MDNDFRIAYKTLRSKVNDRDETIFYNFCCKATQIFVCILGRANFQVSTHNCVIALSGKSCDVHGSFNPKQFDKAFFSVLQALLWFNNTLALKQFLEVWGDSLKILQHTNRSIKYLCNRWFFLKKHTL